MTLNSNSIKIKKASPWINIETSNDSLLSKQMCFFIIANAFTSLIQKLILTV
jgi:hypothetical protein